MVSIVENDFKLTPVSDSSPHFDLELLYTVNKGKSNERQEFRNVGYGMPLFSAIKRVIAYRINNKYNKEAISLKTYIQEFKKELDAIRNLLSEIGI